MEPLTPYTSYPVLNYNTDYNDIEKTERLEE
jgi:hypothetical protein